MDTKEINKMLLDKTLDPKVRKVLEKRKKELNTGKDIKK